VFTPFIGNRDNTRVVVESCWNWSKTYELVKDLVEEVILAHPLKVKAIASARPGSYLNCNCLASALLAKTDVSYRKPTSSHYCIMTIMKIMKKIKQMQTYVKLLNKEGEEC